MADADADALATSVETRVVATAELVADDADVLSPASKAPTAWSRANESATGMSILGSEDTEERSKLVGRVRSPRIELYSRVLSAPGNAFEMPSNAKKNIIGSNARRVDQSPESSPMTSPAHDGCPDLGGQQVG